MESDEDFACAFYGDLFRPRGKAVIEPPFDANDIQEDWEQEMLRLWWMESSQVEANIRGPDADTKARTPQVIQRALYALSHSMFFSNLSERALIYDLKQVYQYLHDPIIRDGARNRVAEAIGSDTRVLIGHSLGSIVAYEALCANPDWPIITFVSIGSPLGIRNLIYDRLHPQPGAWPGNVENWFNVADLGDIVALEKELSGLFGAGVVDCVVNNGAHAHDARWYLTTQETGNAIVSGY